MPATTEPGPDPARRKQLGAWYTPSWLVDYVVDQVARRLATEQMPVRVVDPACGDGRFLAAVADRFPGRVELTGVDIDPRAVEASRLRIGPDAELIAADALTYDWGGRTFDVVIGNPPYLSQMAASTTRGGRSEHGGGVYADAAVEFLALSLRLARTPGAQVALVLPASMLSTRDAGPVRTQALKAGSIEWFWWSPELEFADANIRTFAFGWVSGSEKKAVLRAIGSGLGDATAVPSAALRSASTWAQLIADQVGVPQLPEHWRASRQLGEIAVANANFRDEYYGLIGTVVEAPTGAVLDGPLDSPFGGPTSGVMDEVAGTLWDDKAAAGVSGASGPCSAAFAPLITSGLIDPGRCDWGLRPVRFAKEPFRAPVVDLSLLTPKLRRWAKRKRVPKVLLANQTRVIEAVVDVSGHWLPSVPVINVRPLWSDDLWRCAAALSNPVTSSLAALQGLGAGLSAASIRLSAPKVAHLPIPADRPLCGAAWSRAAALFAAGDVTGCGLLMLEAYEIDAPDAAAWWLSEVERRMSPDRVRRQRVGVRQT